MRKYLINLIAIPAIVLFGASCAKAPNQQIPVRQNNTNASVNVNTNVSQTSTPPHIGQRVVYVFDQETTKPIEGARVTVGFQQWDYLEPKEYKTVASGLAILPPNRNAELAKQLQDTLKKQGGTPPEAELFNYPDIGHIRVDMDGYHFNGLNGESITNLDEFRIGLTRIKNPANFIFIDCDKSVGAYCGYNRYSEGDAVDLQTLAELPRRYYRKVEAVHTGQAFDFKFTLVGNEALEKNVHGKGFATIEFAGDGGVQEVVGQTGGDSGRNEFFAFENLIAAPTNGYLKALGLTSGKTYVARTRDGKHFFKFTTFISKDLEGKNSIEMQIHFQPELSNNLESGKPLAVAPILELQADNVQLATGFSGQSQGSINVFNVGHSDSALKVEFKPLSPNVIILDISNEKNGVSIRRLPPTTIYVYDNKESVTPFATGNFMVYGNTSGDIQLVTNGGTQVVHINYPLLKSLGN